LRKKRCEQQGIENMITDVKGREEKVYKIRQKRAEIRSNYTREERR
jgi:hypothetical protein